MKDTVLKLETLPVYLHSKLDIKREVGLHVKTLPRMQHREEKA